MLRVSFSEKIDVPRLTHGRKPWLEQLFGMSTKNVGGSSGLLLVMDIPLKNSLQIQEVSEIIK